MAEVVVVGAGIAGLGTALALSGQDHRIVVVERDATTLPDSPDAAFEQWHRRGAPQVRHSHAFLARLRNLLRDRAPDVLAALLAAGAGEVRFTDDPPPALAGLEPRPGDDDLVALACRRTTFEWVLRRQVAAAKGVTLTTGTVTGLVADGAAAEVPNVVGVRVAGGAEHRADLVVDASGSRSPLPGWLAAVGAGPVPETEEDTGIVYSSRFYRLLPDAEPPGRGTAVGDLGYLKYAIFQGDNGTFSVTFGLPVADRQLRPLFRPGPFAAAAAAFAAIREWVRPGRAEPITGVEVMGRLLNRRRCFVVAGEPVATGVFAVGDSHICTNPLYGRGCSLAMVQAYLLADTLAAHPSDPRAASLAFAAAVAEEVEPWYHATRAQDADDRRARERAARDEGAEADAGMRSLLRHGLLPAAHSDPLVFRAFLRAFNLLDPPGAMMKDPEVVARVLGTWRERGTRPPPEPLGPGREELLRVISAGAAA